MIVKDLCGGCIAFIFFCYLEEVTPEILTFRVNVLIRFVRYWRELFSANM